MTIWFKTVWVLCEFAGVGVLSIIIAVIMAVVMRSSIVVKGLDQISWRCVEYVLIQKLRDRQD